MRDTHRMREKYDLSLDSRQVVSLLIGGIVVLGAVFVLGVLVGKKLAGTPRADHGPDLLTALDHKSDALERARAAPPLTFQEELTRPTPSAPVTPRTPPAASPLPAAAPAQATTGSTGTASTTVKASPTPASAPVAARPPAPSTSAPATTGSSAAPSTAKASPITASATAAARPSAPSTSAPATTASTGAASTTAKASPTAVSAPVAASGAPGATKASAAPAPHTESVATRTAPAAAHPAPPKAPEATSAAGAFTLQLGASLNRDDAERQASRLRDKGYAPYIVSAEVPGKGTWYRVRMGSFPTKDAATRYLQDFKRETQAEAFVASTR